MAEPAFTLDDVSVVMGTYNEAAAIDHVMDAISAATEDRAEVVVVDASTDGTAERARARGATVIERPPQGYGVALREALTTATGSVIVTTDCDDTYPLDRIPEFLAAIDDGADVVSGDRLSGGATAMPRLNRLGNRAFAWLATQLTGHQVTDVTTGMRAYRCEVIDAITWTENTGLSAELVLRPLCRGYDVREHPIEYRERRGETTLDPVTGGAAIAWSILTVAIQERRRTPG